MQDLYSHIPSRRLPMGFEYRIAPQELLDRGQVLTNVPTTDFHLRADVTVFDETTISLPPWDGKQRPFLRLNIFHLRNPTLPTPAYTITVVSTRAYRRRLHRSFTRICPQHGRNRFCHAKCNWHGIYHPMLDVVRYCYSCQRWFHRSCIFEMSHELSMDLLQRELKWIPTSHVGDQIWWQLVSAPIERAPVVTIDGTPVYPSSFEKCLRFAKHCHFLTYRPPVPNISAWTERVQFPTLPSGWLLAAVNSARYFCPQCGYCI